MPAVDFLHQHYFATMGPMIIITVTAFIVMILEFVFQRGDRRWLSGLSLLGVLGALAVAIAQFGATPQLALNTMASDAFASVFSVLLLVSAALVLLFTWDYSGHTKLAAEHTYLLLFAIVGALAMATSVDLITLYVGLELLSVSSYVLVAVRRKSMRAVEGGAKYLIMGSLGSAVLLYGMSFLYGITGNTNLILIGQTSASLWTNYPAIVTLSFVLMLAGMGVKLSLVPFHMWTPDAYDGAPAPISAFLATLSKSASFAMLLRMLLFAFYGGAAHVFYWAGILAAITMVVGNLIALPQRNMKRLLAFSSVAQAGYILVPFALIGTSAVADWPGLFDSIAFYLFGYAFMTIGAFAVVHVVSRDRRTIDSDALLGLYQRSPWLALALTVFLLSLSGMPLTAGFIGKFYIFADTVHLHDLWLGIVLFSTSVVSLFYYFGWIRKVFHKEPIGEVQPLRAGNLMHTVLGLCVVGTLALGLIPGVLMHALQTTRWF